MERSLKEIERLKKEYSYSPHHTKWLSDTLYLLEDIFGRNSRIFLMLAGLDCRFKGGFYTDMFSMDQELQRREKIAYLEQIGIAKGLISSGIQQIRNKGVKSVYEGKDTPPESSEIIKILSLINNKLRKVIRNPPLHEIEIQNALENLFIGANLYGQFTREKRILFTLRKCIYLISYFRRLIP